MTGVGIVRRIDELGRIVIPKEIRRTMHIKEGDEMEICSSGDALMLRKYSSLESVMPIIRSAAKLLAKETDGSVLFADTQSVMVAEGKSKRAYQSQTLSEEFASLVRERKSMDMQGEQIRKIFDDADVDFKRVIAEPVIVGGDLMGVAILMFDSEEDVKPYLNFCVELIAAAML